MSAAGHTPTPRQRPHFRTLAGGRQATRPNPMRDPINAGTAGNRKAVTMTTTKTDTASIPALIEAAEARATCKMGMAKARSRFLVVLAPEDAKALGVCGGALNLHVAARQGTVDLVYAVPGVGDDNGYREISEEPAEPDAQEWVVAYARRNPIGAALDLLRIDLERRAA